MKLTIPAVASSLGQPEYSTVRVMCQASLHVEADFTYGIVGFGGQPDGNN